MNLNTKNEMSPNKNGAFWWAVSSRPIDSFPSRPFEFGGFLMLVKYRHLLLIKAAVIYITRISEENLLKILASAWHYYTLSEAKYLHNRNRNYISALVWRPLRIFFCRFCRNRTSLKFWRGLSFLTLTIWIFKNSDWRKQKVLQRHKPLYHSHWGNEWSKHTVQMDKVSSESRISYEVYTQVCQALLSASRNLRGLMRKTSGAMELTEKRYAGELYISRSLLAKRLMSKIRSEQLDQILWNCPKCKEKIWKFHFDYGLTYKWKIEAVQKCPSTLHWQGDWKIEKNIFDFRGLLFSF